MAGSCAPRKQSNDRVPVDRAGKRAADVHPPILRMNEIDGQGHDRETDTRIDEEALQGVAVDMTTMTTIDVIGEELARLADDEVEAEAETVAVTGVKQEDRLTSITPQKYIKKLKNTHTHGQIQL